MSQVNEMLTQMESFSGVFIAIGHTPNTSLFEGVLEAKDGYLVVQGGREGNATATNIEGIFAAGDVRPKDLRQVTTAVGEGSVAGQEAYNYLQAKGFLK